MEAVGRLLKESLSCASSARSARSPSTEATASPRRRALQPVQKLVGFARRTRERTSATTTSSTTSPPPVTALPTAPPGNWSRCAATTTASPVSSA